MEACRIAIVGGGYSGAVAALLLLRTYGPALMARVDIIEPRALLARGLAYGTSDPAHRVNAPAQSLSLFAEDPAHFDTWLRREQPVPKDLDALTETGEFYVRRELFGRYVAQLLEEAAAESPGLRLRHVRARATGVCAGAKRFAVSLNDGERLEADILVLALGIPPPSLPAPLRGLAGDHRLVHDPLDGIVLSDFAGVERVLLVGSGLTMCDVVASLRSRGYVGSFTALSRHGLLPHARPPVAPQPVGDFVTAPSRTALALLQRVRTAAREHAALGGGWPDVTDAVRRQGMAIWAALPRVEQARFLRHLRPLWDVHRYQSPPQVAARVADDLAAGRLRIVKGRLLDARQDDAGFRVTFRARGAPATAHFQAIVNCTGPDPRSWFARQPLLQSLREAGLVQPDIHGLGLRTDRKSRAVGTDGRVNPRIYVVGPPARGTFGELMGAPQIADHIRDIVLPDLVRTHLGHGFAAA